MRLKREPWLQQVPKSRMVYPRTVSDQCKYWLWRIYTPIHPLVREASSRLGVRKQFIRYIGHEMEHTAGRQDFLIGVVHPRRSIQELVSFLVAQGFGNHFVAWKDSDEVVSLRKTLDFEHQYHIRIFADGEVRCHYEYTPESHPILHLIRIGFEDRTLEFSELLRGWVQAPDDSPTKKVY
jgi:hypothetical protein